MALGAGLGTVVGGIAALLFRRSVSERVAAAGTVIGVGVGALVVLAGNLKADITDWLSGPVSTAVIVLAVSALLRLLPGPVTGRTRRATGDTDAQRIERERH